MEQTQKSKLKYRRRIDIWKPPRRFRDTQKTTVH